MFGSCSTKTTNLSYLCFGSFYGVFGRYLNTANSRKDLRTDLRRTIHQVIFLRMHYYYPPGNYRIPCRGNSKLPLLRGYVSSQEDVYIYIYIYINMTAPCAFYLLFNLPRSPGPQHPPGFYPKKSCITRESHCRRRRLLDLVLFRTSPVLSISNKKKDLPCGSFAFVGCHIVPVLLGIPTLLEMLSGKASV